MLVCVHAIRDPPAATFPNRGTVTSTRGVAAPADDTANAAIAMAVTAKTLVSALIGDARNMFRALLP